MTVQMSGALESRTSTGTVRRHDQAQKIWYIDPNDGGPQVQLSDERLASDGGAVHHMRAGAEIIYQINGESSREVVRVVTVR